MKITKNEQFEKDGYLLLPNLVSNPESLYYKPMIDEVGNPKCGTASYHKPAYDIIKKSLEKIWEWNFFPHTILKGFIMLVVN